MSFYGHVKFILWSFLLIILIKILLKIGTFSNLNMNIQNRSSFKFMPFSINIEFLMTFFLNNNNNIRRRIRQIKSWIKTV